ncbi:hypothetical protein GCM10009092_06630 [Bowmanella denitrificans]|uniref:Uncharacterized protein n=1 Tax=Bowmanella denitrificans TaxID=366582 RepID=A0ABP3GJF1_9ALTE
MPSIQPRDFSVLDAVLIVLTAILLYLMFRPNVRQSTFWQATVTPLASIIGSGFLVVVPLLANIAGHWAWLAILVICLLSLWLGHAMRFTMEWEETQSQAQPPDPLRMGLDRFADVALAFAYVISITFYIRLMAGFVLTGLDIYSEFNADVLATLVLAGIGIYGLFKGLHGLEKLETYSVSIKLAIIVALLAGLIWHDIGQGYSLTGLTAPSQSLAQSLAQLGGMLLIVQGFETSKYLGSEYPAKVRMQSMILAQRLAAAIYISFVVLAMPLMSQFVGSEPNETAIIALSGQITLILPVLLVIAAAMSQFSAAIADTIGAGGVVEKESRHHLPARRLYPLITALSIALLWSSNIFQLVTYASKAFAFYYMLQALIAARLASHETKKANQALAFLCLAVLMLMVVLFAVPVEG